MTAASPQEPLVPPAADSPLSMWAVRLDAGERLAIGARGCDTFLFAFEGAAATGAGETLRNGSALFVPAGESAELVAGESGFAALHAEADPRCDEHAPLGDLARIAVVDPDATDAATGKRTYQILFGPHNGSRRATLFVGYIPPGRVPWHFHQYDEIVWIWQGDARFHVAEGAENLPGGTAVRMRPRQVHILENRSKDGELVVVGLFTPAGSPSAAFLASDPTQYSMRSR